MDVFSLERAGDDQIASSLASGRASRIGYAPESALISTRGLSTWGREANGRVALRDTSLAVLYAHDMSKLDAQRAMRAARYDARAAASARAATGTPVANAPTTPRPARAKSAPAPAPAATPDAPTAELCGHRSSIGGKFCKRPAGHSETTHRYS